MELENDNFLDLVFWFLNFFPNENQHHNLEKGFIQTNMHMTLAQATARPRDTLFLVLEKNRAAQNRAL